jgi:hypothetical protein
MNSDATNKGDAPIASYVDVMTLSILGKREYTLFPGCVSYRCNIWGQKCETTIPLEGIKLEPEYHWVHGFLFRICVVVIAVELVLVVAASLIFVNFQQNILFWYLSAAIIMALGIVGCIKSFRGIRTIRFLSKAGVPLLGVVAWRKSKRNEQDAFVHAIQNQIMISNDNQKGNP